MALPLAAISYDGEKLRFVITNNLPEPTTVVGMARVFNVTN
jgi:hypothetical protein